MGLQAAPEIRSDGMAGMASLEPSAVDDFYTQTGFARPCARRWRSKVRDGQEPKGGTRSLRQECGGSPQGDRSCHRPGVHEALDAAEGRGEVDDLPEGRGHALVRDEPHHPSPRATGCLSAAQRYSGALDLRAQRGREAVLELAQIDTQL